MPPRFILQEKNWLLSLVSKGSFEIVGPDDMVEDGTGRVNACVNAFDHFLVGLFHDLASIAYVHCAYKLFGVLCMVLQGLN